MPRKPEPLEPWMLDAIELIVRRDLTLRMAAQQLGQDLTPQQCDNLMGRIRFQRELEEARLKYYAEIASHPRFTKDAVIGYMFKLAERLAEDRDDAKATEALFRIAKVQGWTSGEDYREKPVLANLTQADIDRVRAEYKAKQQGKQDDNDDPQEDQEQGTTSVHAKVN